MARWQCPHCGAPQAETARCWVCHRSSTTCSTCRHFRRSLATDVGYCGLDPRRRPLSGLELRGCWAGAPTIAAEPIPVPTPRPASPEDGGRGRRTFIPLEAMLQATLGATEPLDAASSPMPIEPLERVRDRVTLFELEP